MPGKLVDLSESHLSPLKEDAECCATCPSDHSTQYGSKRYIKTDWKGQNTTNGLVIFNNKR